MAKDTELEFIKSQKRHDPICAVREGDLRLVEAWLNDTISSQQMRAARSWTGNNTKYWAATVLKAAYKRGQLMIKK